MASHSVTAWLPTLVTNLSSLHLTYDCHHNRVHKQTDWHRHSSQTMSFHLSPSAHTTHTMWIGWNAVTAATDSSLASLLVADSPSHNTSTQTIVFIASTLRLPPARDDSPQSFYKHTTHISYHSGETLRSVRHPRFQPTAARRGPRVFQPIDDSTKSSHPNLSTDHRREHTVSCLSRSKQAIDESTKSSSSKQSTSVPPPTHWTTSTAELQERQLVASTADHALTNHTHKLSRCTHARTRRWHSPYENKLQDSVCQSRTNSLSLLKRIKQIKKRKEKKERTTHSPHKHKWEKRTSVTSVLKEKKNLLSLRVSVSKQNKKKKKKKFRRSSLSVLLPKLNKKKKKKKKTIQMFRCKKHYLPQTKKKRNVPSNVCTNSVFSLTTRGGSWCVRAVGEDVKQPPHYVGCSGGPAPELCDCVEVHQRVHTCLHH